MHIYIIISYLKYYYQREYAIEEQARIRYEKLLILFSRHSGEKSRSRQGCPGDSQDRENQTD